MHWIIILFVSSNIFITFFIYFIKLEPRFSAPYPAISLDGGSGVRLQANFEGPFQCFPNVLNLKDFNGVVPARSIL